MTISDVHRQYLNDHAITDETLAEHLVRSEGEEIVFPWRKGDVLTEQRRPWPGESGVYFWESGKDLHFGELRDAGNDAPILLVEGTKQALAAASWAPDGYSVLGMAGCWGWIHENLSRLKGRTVLMCLDADAASNLDVYDAGEKFAEKAKRFKIDVKFLRIPGTGSQGLDDYLATLDEEDRTEILAYEIENAGPKPAERRPTTRKRKMESDLPDTGDRVPVAVNLDRKMVVDKITGALKDKHDAKDLFNYGEILTRVKGHETQPLDRDRFHAILVDAVACFKYSEATDKRPAIFEPTWPDGQSIGAVMSKAEEFSTLRRVVRVPFIRPDGSLCATPGYDRDTATVLVPSGLGDLHVPDEPTADETRMAAKFLMTDWLGDMPFKSPADRANALAMLLTPFVRGTVPLVPLGVVNGMEAGVGKNLLADCIAILATGEAAMPLPYVQQEEEMRKQITAAFASGAELFVFDEAHVIEGAQFSRAVTSLTYADRVLGVSRIAQFPNQVTWMSLGNQVQVNGDMSRRVYFVYLHPTGTTLADREAYGYRHPDLKAWTAQNRTQLVSAALTVLRGWEAAGRPSYSRGASMGSFEPWDRRMSGCLAYAGYPEFLTDSKERRSESDFQQSYWEAHVHWLREVFGSDEFTTAQVREAALKDPKGYEAPPNMEDASGKNFTRLLGQGYAKHADRTYAGLTLRKAGMGHKSTLKWRVDKNDGGNGGNGGNALAPSNAGDSSYVPSRDDVAQACVPRGEEAGAFPPVPSVTSTEVVRSGSGEPFCTTSGVAVGFDIETASADELFTGNHEGPFVRLAGAIDSNDKEVGPASPMFVAALNAADVIYGHNVLAYDLIALARHNGADYDALAAKSIDLRVLGDLMDPPAARRANALPMDLDSMAKRLGHEGKTDDLKALAKEFGGYDRIPVDDARYVDYLRGDLAATKFVYEGIRMLRKPGESSASNATIRYAEREMKVLALVNRMTLNGWKVDVELLAELVKREDEQRAAAIKSLHEDYGMPLAKPDRFTVAKDWREHAAGRSHRVVTRYVRIWPEAAAERGLAVRIPGEVLKSPWAGKEGRPALIKAFADAGAPHYPKTESGELALSADALGEGTWYDKKERKAKPGMLASKYGKIPAVRRLVETIGHATGATAKYAEIQRYVTAEGRVHARTGAPQASGRWATSEPATANLGKRGEKVEQRRPFVADEGHVQITCDLAQVDVRSLAGHSQDPELIAMLQPGEDYHLSMAEMFTGERTKEGRKRFKPVAHGINYNESAWAIAEKEGLDFEFVQSAVAKHAERLHVLAEKKLEWIELARSGALLDNGFGRLMRCDPERAWTQAPALIGQGGARDIMTESLLRFVDLAEKSFDRGRQARDALRGVVHDEVVISVPEDESALWRNLLETAFTWEWRGVPILCEVSQPGRNWAECV